MKNNYKNKISLLRNLLVGMLVFMLVLSNVYAAGVIGKQGILQITTMDGKQINLKQYRGKPVLIVFWATWCNTCVVEMPALQKFYVKHKNEFQLLAISVDRSREAVQEYIEKNKLTYPVAWLEAKGTKSNFDNIQTTPTFFVVDPTGKVVKKLYGRLSEAKIKQVIKQWGLTPSKVN